MTSNKILACVDGSLYTESICAHAAWVSQRVHAPVQVVHAQTLGSEPDAARNLSGTMKLGMKSALLEKLSQLDEERNKIELQKGKLILEHAKELLTEAGLDSVETLHRRGSVVEAVAELEEDSQLTILGKRGENADFATMHLGSNLERIVRAAHNPVMVASRAFKPISRFIIAYDGGPSTVKAIDYVLSQPLLQGLECHLLHVGADNVRNRTTLSDAEAKLTQGGFSVTSSLRQGPADEVIAEYVKSNEMDLLIMGAYGHSQIRTLIIGSTTSSMLRSCLIPVLMFR